MHAANTPYSDANSSVDRDRPLVMVAVGGHAFLQGGEKPTIDVHHENAKQLSSMLRVLIERDYDIVITHGNGPQVGQLLLQSDLARSQVPAMPLDVLVADTEGWLGYVLQQAMLNELRRSNIKRYVVTMVTQVLVDRDDPAFQSPTKPVGPVMTEAVARDFETRMGWHIKNDPGRGFRRVVPSPKPKRVVQRHMIRDAAKKGHIVIAGGGGGIPIIKNIDNDYQGVEAVIDKDLTSSILAANIGAELLIILTAVPQVYLNFGEDSQHALGAVTMDECRSLMAAGHFPAGSMGPKVQAIYNFLEAGGRRGLITDAASLSDAMAGKGGTHFVGKL